jgi:adenosylmethionine-8-amino-7-oxononanoate aminotransferase
MHSSDLSFDQNITQAQSFDHEHIWHPYTSMANQRAQGVWPVESANGVRIKLAATAQQPSIELIDGMASWWSVVHGYNQPRLNQALQDQCEKVAHVMFGGLTHEPAILLAKKLVDLSPEGLNKVFLADSGSVAVEVAIKMAVQYQHARGKEQKHKLISLKKGYHGDTLGAMSLCDPSTGMHHLFTGILPKQFFIQEPQIGFYDQWNDQDIQPLKDCLVAHHQDIAALIVEPIVQGAGGMRFYHPEYLRQARILCDEYDVLLIADEIATGFGRTGEFFACDHAQISPDILCVGKAITGGYMTLSATLTTDHVAMTISEGEAGCFMHGPTFMGNPLACAVANESLNLLQETNWKENVTRVEKALIKGLAPATKLSTVVDVRVLGAIGVIELKEPVDLTVIQPKFIERGIWLRPFGKLVYVMPAYVMSNEDLAILTAGMFDVLAELAD